MHFRRANVMCSSSSPFPGYIFFIVLSIKINCYHIYFLFFRLFWLHITTLFGASRDKIVDSLFLTVIDNKSDLYLNLIWFVVFSATFNNSSVISWRSVLMMEETGGSTRRKPEGVLGGNHRPVASQWQTLSHDVVSNYPSPEWDSNSQD